MLVQQVFGGLGVQTDRCILEGKRAAINSREGGGNDVVNSILFAQVIDSVVVFHSRRYRFRFLERPTPEAHSNLLEAFVV